ncbi:MAG: hemerythrin domain-containing protein [Acidobacteriota bacterium]
MDSIVERLAREHRALDELFGRFLGAAHAGDADAAREAIRDFDDALRRHMAFEEERVMPPPSGHKLAPPEAEAAGDRLFRELRLEHVQIRELSGIMRRLLEEQNDWKGAERLAGNLARRWDAHTAREEKAVADLG